MKRKILTGFGAAFVVALIGYIVLFVTTINRLKKPALYEVDGMALIEPLKDIEYKRVEGQPLQLDIYLPNKGEAPYPVLLLIQGNGADFLTKNSKNWGLFNSYGRIMAVLGYAVVVANRRESMDFSEINQSAEDIKDQIEFLKRNAATYRLNMDRLGIWAFSAGAAYLPIVLEQPERFRVMISYYGLLDLRLFKSNVSGKVPSSIIDKYSATTWISKDLADLPMLIATGRKDSLGAVLKSNQAFVEKGRELNLNVTHLVHQEGHHGFDALDDNDHTREIIGETIDFIRDHL